MKAAIVRAPDAAPEYGEFPEPGVGEGRELVELVAAGIHPFVRTAATGRHYGSTGDYPLIPGVDAVARTAGGDLDPKSASDWHEDQVTNKYFNLPLCVDLDR